MTLITMTDMIEIITPEFNRNEELGFQTPQTKEEFYGIVNNAPSNILFEFGFRKWSSINELIAENNEKPERKTVKLPAINLTDDPDNDFFEFEVGRNPKVPQTQLEHDEMIWLFPAEWYDLIPTGFVATNITGVEIVFKHGVTDSDRRFGCLAFGIRRTL